MLKNKYVPSVNILRDSEKSISYFPTPNGNRIVGQIVDDFKKGLRAFNLIGSYGTGKSSFLLALEQSLYDKKPYYTANFLSKPVFGAIKLVGEYRSIISAFADLFNLPYNKDVIPNIFQEIYNSYHDLKSEQALLAVEIDEFGKFLEYAAQNHSERELYFIQQLAEFVGNTDRNIFLITTIHQSFESYAYGLTSAQRQEWTKVKGRFREITFNEPVEQLLFLAAEHIDQSTVLTQSKTILKKSFEIFSETKAFSFSEKFTDEINSKIYPLDILSANILTLALQRYGQNERSLFSFLESTDHTGLSKFNNKLQPFYDISSVYDYLNFNFYSFLTSKYNPDFAAWSSIRAALETAERAFDERINEYHKIIKVIGMLNIFSASGSKLDRKFLDNYANNCLGIAASKKLIENLEIRKIVRFRDHSKRFVLYEGTDLDIQTALLEAANKVSEITDVPTLLKKHFDFTPVLTKAYSFETGTPRYFKYIFSETPIKPIFEDEIDGYINLVFNEKSSSSDVLNFSSQVEDAVLYGYYNNSKEIRNLLYEIEKTQNVIDENKDDKIANKELENILSSQQNLLNHYILNGLHAAKDGVVWLWRGQEIIVDSKRIFNRVLSQICFQTYLGTPIFKNELVNRPKLSGSVYAAKRNYFVALTSNWDKQDLGFEQDKFPPEKTIYLTLLKENGLTSNSLITNDGVNESSSFSQLWKECNLFLLRCKDSKRNLEELTDVLKTRPFRLKQGFIDFWIPTFLFLKRNELALFSSEGYIPELNSEILDLISKNPRDYSIKAFDIEGVKLDIFNSYRIFLNKQIEFQITNKSFIETIKPFLVFYRQLPEYSKQTKRLSKNALAIKNAIAISKDPEKTFFEDFPGALGTSLTNLKNDKDQLNEFTQSLQNAIREIRTSYENLIDRIEEYLQVEIIGEKVDFEEYKELLKERFKTVKRHLLLPHQKSFIQRIDSALDDKKAWLNSISQSITGKSLENFKDDDEIILFDKLHNVIFELDSLSKLSKIQIDESKEEVLGIQFDSITEGVKQNLVRYPKNKLVKIDIIKSDLKKVLSKDRVVDIAALTKLLQEIIGNE